MPTLAKSYQQIKDNPELLAILAEKVKGKGPNGSDLPLEKAILTVPMDDNGAQAGDFDAEPAPGTIRTLAETALGSVSTAVPTGLGSLAVGAATTALTRKPLVGMAAGMVAGIPIAKYATGPLGRVLNKKLLPESINRDVEIQGQVNPVASTVGGALANLVIQRPTFGKTAVDIIKKPSLLTKPVELGKLMAKDTTALESLKPLNLGVGIGSMAATDYGMQLAETGDVDWKRVGASAAIAPILGGGEFRGAIPKIVANRIYRPIMERQLKQQAAEFKPVILKNPDGTPMDQEAAKLHVLDLYEKDPTSQRFVDAKAELEQYTGYPLDIEGGMKWKKAVMERREADLEKNKTAQQKAAELEAITKEEQHPAAYLKWLGDWQFKNAKGKTVQLKTKEDRLAYAERDAKELGGTLRKQWEAEVAAKEAAKAKEKEKPAKPPKEPAAPPAQPPAKPALSVEEALTEMMDRHASGELKNLDWDLVKSGVDKLPTKYQPDPESPEGQAAWKAVNEAIAKAEKQAGLKQGELLAKDSNQVLTLAPWKFGSDPASAAAYAKRFAHSLAKDIKGEGGVLLQAGDVQDIVNANAKAPGKTLPVGGVAEEVAPAKVATGEASVKPIVEEEAAPPAEPAAAPAKSSPEADLIPFDLNNPEHAKFDAMSRKVFGVSAEDHRAVTATDKYIPNPKGVPVKAGKSSIEGTGNILTADIPAGAAIGKIYTPQKAEPTKSIQTSLGRYTNHSDTPNAEVALVEFAKTPSGYPVQELVLKAKGALAKGTELTVDYAQAKPLIEEYKKNLELAGADTVEVKKGTPVKVKRAKEVKAVAAKPTTAVEPPVSSTPISPATVGSESPKGAEASATTISTPKPAAGEPNNAAAQYKAIGDFVTAAKERDSLADPNPEQLLAAQQKVKAAESVLSVSHGMGADELTALKDVTFSALDEGLDIKAATDRAYKEIVGTEPPGVVVEAPTPGTPYKPAIKGDVGSGLGGVVEMARATGNVSKQVYTKAKDYLGKINKGFQEGRAGEGPKGMELYSFPGPIHKVIGDSIKTIVKLGGRAAYSGTERWTEGAGERLSRTRGPSGAYFREHARSFFRYERQLQNEFLEPVFKATDIGLTKAQREKVGKYAIDMDEYEASPIALTPDELRVYNLIRASYDSSRIAQQVDGPWINGQPVSGPTKYFNPKSVMGKKVRDVLLSTDKTNEGQRKYFTNLYEQWYRQQSPKPDSMTEADYVANIHESLGEYLGKDPFMGKRNPTFSPLYKHEGIGLPPAMRELDIIDAAGHYGRRWAAGLAWYRSVQKDPIMARIMGVTNDGRGNDYVPPTRDLLPSDSNPQQYEITDYSPTPEYAKNLSNDPDLETYRAQMMRGATQHYDWVDRSTALANSTMLGPLTAFRDVVSSSLGSMGEIAKVSDIPAWTKAWGKVLSGESTALEAGAVRGRNTAEFAIDNSIRRIDGKIADVMRKYQGRDLMEKGIREVLFELGKEMAANRLASRSTNPSTIAANNKFFETYGGKTWKKLSREELLNTVGTAVMEQMQGSYTPEYLPRVLSVGAGPSLTKATFSLSRWGVERFRRYRQTVIRPIAEDGNILPLAKSTAIYLGLATPAVNAIVQWFTGKKPRNTTWGEYFNLVKDGRPDAHLMDELAYDIAANASLSGMAGILGGLVYQGMQLRHGERAMGYGNPGVSALVDMGKRVADYFQVYSGADLLKNLWRLPTETVLQEVQTLRLIRNALDKRPDSGNREEQIYDRVRGKTKFGLGDKATANPFSPLTKMRKAQTVDDILASGQDLERMYQDVMPERAGRFHNPLRLPPSPEDAIAGENFYRFTTAMQTPEALRDDPRGMSPESAGGQQLQRDAAQMGLNQVRAGVANMAFQRARARNLLERVRAAQGQQP